MNGGIYLFKKKILNNFKKNKISLENDFFNKTNFYAKSYWF